MTQATVRQQKYLPADWRERVAAIPDHSGAEVVLQALELRKPFHLVEARRDVEFNAIITPKVVKRRPIPDVDFVPWLEVIDALPDGTTFAQIVAAIGVRPADFETYRKRYAPLGAACAAKMSPRTSRKSLDTSALVLEMNSAASTLAVVGGNELTSTQRQNARHLLEAGVERLRALTKELREVRSRLNEAQALYARLRSGSMPIHRSGTERSSL
jgi:hypothetical protein